MKENFAIALISVLLFLTACQDDTAVPNVDPLGGSWNLINVSGGFAGIDENFPEGSIVWTFEEDSGMLTVLNTNTSNALYDGLGTGEYSYAITEHQGNSYLFIDNLESGAMLISGEQMVLNQNLMIDGSGADMFVLQLKK